MPVGANTTYFFFVCWQMYFKNVDLPVPAFPVRMLADVFQERRFTRPRFPGQEYGLAGILDEFQCVLKLGVAGIYFDG